VGEEEEMEDEDEEEEGEEEEEEEEEGEGGGWGMREHDERFPCLRVNLREVPLMPREGVEAVPRAAPRVVRHVCEGPRGGRVISVLPPSTQVSGDDRQRRASHVATSPGQLRWLRASTAIPARPRPPHRPVFLDHRRRRLSHRPLPNNLQVLRSLAPRRLRDLPPPPPPPQGEPQLFLGNRWHEKCVIRTDVDLRCVVVGGAANLRTPRALRWERSAC